MHQLLPVHDVAADARVQPAETGVNVVHVLMHQLLSPARIAGKDGLTDLAVVVDDTLPLLDGIHRTVDPLPEEVLKTPTE